MSHHVIAGTQHRLAPQAELAVAAEYGQAGDDRVARLHVCNLLAHRLHDARRLMAQDGRHGYGVKALNEVQVTVANATGPGANQDFPRARVVYLHLFHLQGPVYLTQHCGFHSSPPFNWENRRPNADSFGKRRACAGYWQ